MTNYIQIVNSDDFARIDALTKEGYKKVDSYKVSQRENRDGLLVPTGIIEHKVIYSLEFK